MYFRRLDTLGRVLVVLLLALTLYVRRKRAAGLRGLEESFFGHERFDKRLLGKPPGAATEMMARGVGTRQAAYSIGEGSSLSDMLGGPSNGVEGRLGAQSVMVNPLSMATRPTADSFAGGLWLEGLPESGTDEMTAMNPLAAAHDPNADAEADLVSGYLSQPHDEHEHEL